MTRFIQPGRGGLTVIKMTCIVLLALLTFSRPLFAAGGDIIWQAGDPLPGKQEATGVTVDSGGNVIITGFQNASGGADENYHTIKFRSDGSGVAWRAVYDRAGLSDQATGVAVDAAGDIIVTGFATNGINTDIHTIKYNGTTGAVLWQHSFDGFVNGNDVATSVAVDTLNNIYVAGYSQNSDGFNDYIVIRYAPAGPNPDGTPAWVRMNEGTAGGNDQVTSISTAVTAGMDGLAVTGQAWNGSSFDILTVKYDFSGNKLWEKRYSTAPTYACIGRQVRMDSAGNVIITGSVENGVDLDIYTAKYRSADGVLLWERTFNGAYDDEPTGMVIDTDDDVFITGYTWTLAASNNFYTARYSGSTGALLWEQHFDSGSGDTDLAVATGISVDPGSDLFVTGYTITDGRYDIQTIKYKRDNGSQLWNHSFDGAAGLNDRPVGIGFTSTGDLLVGGWSESVGNAQDFLAIKYDAGMLNAPTLLAAETLPDATISIAWTDNSPNETGFAIERKLGETGSYLQIATVSADTVSYHDTTGLNAGNIYFYRVRAFSDASGFSHYSNEAHALTVYVGLLPPAWSYTYNNPDSGDDYANAIATGPDNHPVVTGYSLLTVGGFDYYTLKLNRSDRSVLWSDLYDDPDSELDIAKCLTVDGSSNAIVSGYASLYFDPAGRNINSIFTLKYPASGPPATWSAQYNGPGAIDDRATAIANASDSSGSVVVTGYGKNVAGNEDIYLVKYHADGSRAWAATPFDGPGHGDDFPSAVALAPDGSVVVTGYSETADGSGIYSLVAAKYNGATGALLWSEVYSVTAGGDTRGNGIAVDAAGEIYVTGTATNAAGNSDIYTIRYSGTAGVPVRVWEHSYDGPGGGNDLGTGIAVDPIDGAVVVAGTALVAPGDRDMTLIRYAADGSSLWPGDGSRSVRRHDTDEQLMDLAIDPSGYLYLAGNTASGGAVDIIAFIMSHEGALLGAATYAGTAGGFDEAASIAANTVGESFIAGYTTSVGGNADYVVFKQVNPGILVPSPFSATAPSDFSRMNLAWINSTASAGVRIERTLGPATPESVWTQIAVLPAGSTSYQDSGLNQGTSYCYRITASSGSLDSRKVISCAVTTLAPPILSPVAAVSATANDLAWLNVAGNSGYRVERLVAGGSWFQAALLPADTTLFHDTGLTAGVVYSYRVITLSSVGSSLASTVQTMPVLYAPSGITSARIDLTWPAVAGATGYRLERSTDGLAWAQIAAPAAAAIAYSDTTVGSGLQYFYRLRVDTASGSSGASLVRSAISLLKTPAPGAAAAVSTTRIDLSWSDPNGNETGYLAEYAACSSSYDNQATCTSYLNYDWAWSAWVPVSLSADVTGTSFNDLTPGRTYRFRVTATLSGANSVPSTAVAGTANLVAPTNLSATAATGSSATLSWSDVLGENGYRVYKDGVLLTTLSRNVVTYTATGLSMNTLYRFKVQPYNTTSSADSNEAQLTIYGPPTLNSVTVDSSTQVTLSWNDVAGETGYEVWRALPTSQSSPTTWGAYSNLTGTPLIADTVSFANTLLTAGYSYRYKIRYQLPDGSFSAYSNEIQTTTVPATPNLSATAIAATQIRLNWGDGFGETGYDVQHKSRVAALCSAEDWSGVTPLTLGAGSITTTISSLQEGTSYCFRIRATNAGGSSTWGGAVTQTTLLSPPTLNALSGITQSKIDLSWNNVTGNNGYRIERSTDGVSWGQIYLPGVNVVTWSDTSVTANQIYYYRVSTKNSANAYSIAGNVQSATTLPVSPPVLSSLSGVTISQMTLSWSDVAGNNGYKVERSLNNSSWSQIATPASGAVSYTNTGLSAGTLYYYRVSTKNAAGSYSAPSNVQSATTTPAAPAATVKVQSESGMDLSWQVMYGATNYRILRSTGGAGPAWIEIANRAIGYSTLYCGLYPLSTIGCPTLVPAFTSHADSGLTADTLYCYKMQSWNATGGDSADSSPVCAKTPAVNGPTLTSVTAVNSMKMGLTWSYNPAACTPEPCDTPDGFEIWRQARNGAWVQIDTVPNLSAYQDTVAIEPLKSYLYKVRGYRGGDLSPFSNILGGTTPAYQTGDATCP